MTLTKEQIDWGKQNKTAWLWLTDEQKLVFKEVDFYIIPILLVVSVALKSLRHTRILSALSLRMAQGRVRIGI